MALASRENTPRQDRSYKPHVNFVPQYIITNACTHLSFVGPLTKLLLPGSHYNIFRIGHGNIPVSYLLPLRKLTFPQAIFKICSNLDDRIHQLWNNKLVDLPSPQTNFSSSFFSWKRRLGGRGQRSSLPQI